MASAALAQLAPALAQHGLTPAAALVMVSAGLPLPGGIRLPAGVTVPAGLTLPELSALGLSPAALSLTPGAFLSAGLSASPVLATLVGQTGAGASEVAQGATSDIARPALTHVAWADAWLSRFAGATGPAADAPPSVRPATFGAPPQAVFVSPEAAPLTAAQVSPVARPGAGAPRTVAPSATVTPASGATTAPPSVVTAEPTGAPLHPASSGTPHPLSPAASLATAALPAGVQPEAAPAPRAQPIGFAPAPFSPTTFATGLLSALVASPAAPALADLLGLPAPMFASSGTLIERLTTVQRPSAVARSAMPELVYPRLEAPQPQSLPQPQPQPQTTAAPAPRSPGRLPSVPETPVASVTPEVSTPMVAASFSPPTIVERATAPQVAGQAREPEEAAELHAIAAPEAEVGEAPSSPTSPVAGTSMRPGSLGAKVEAFAMVERLRSTGLALDFISPELYAAARTYGFNGADAARAAHLAEAGFPVLAALAAGADMALSSFYPSGYPSGHAASPPSSMTPASSRAASAPGLVLPTAAMPSQKTASAAQAARAGIPSSGARAGSPAADLTPLVPGAMPRGAFLLPRVARELLSGRAPGEAPYSVLPMELAALDVLAAGAVASSDGSSDTPVGAARQAFGDDLTLAAHWGAASTPEAREASPLVRAARAMALAAASVVPGGGVTGGMPGFSGGFVMPGVAGSTPTTDVVPRDVGLALQALVAPSAPTPQVAPAHSVSSSFAGRQVARPAFLPSTSPQATSAPAAAELVKTGASESGRSAGAGFEIPDWFEAAARKMLADKSGADDRLGLPELTLIGAAATSSTTRLAADKGEGVSSLKATASAGGGGDEKGKDDVHDLAREIFEEIRRLQEAAHLRSGG